MDIRIFNSKNPDVWKYVFFNKEIVFEAVLYRYKNFQERTVICCSTQSGCPAGCTFCGTSKRFVRNLTAKEIADQINYLLKNKNITATAIRKFQIMFMSMGEPMLNWDNVEKAIRILHKKYPKAQLLLSTIGVHNQTVLKKIIEISKEIPKVGIQFSIHEYSDKRRGQIMPYPRKMSLHQIADYGKRWRKETGRYPFLNYIVREDNTGKKAAISLRNIFDPYYFKFTLSILCEIDKNKNPLTNNKLKEIDNFRNQLLPLGYNIRIFNPGGQDDIGGGCGQLWFVQQYLNNSKFSRSI